VQGFGNSPTQISKFLCLGDIYVPTDQSTGQIGTQGLVHIKEHAKLYILSGGQRLLRGSWPFGAGVWEFPHTNFEIFGFGGTIFTHGSRYTVAMAKEVGAY
jgi:hypothetical protein